MSHYDQHNPQPLGLIRFLRGIWSLARARPLAALLADVIATHDPLAQDVAQRLKSPGVEHYFGTDGFGA